MLIGGIERKGHIERGNRRQRQAPERPQFVEPQGRAERQRHQQPDEQAEELCHAAGEERQRHRRQVNERKTGDRAGKKERRVFELCIGGTRYHAGDVGEARGVPALPTGLGFDRRANILPVVHEQFDQVAQFHHVLRRSSTPV
jgi:hypothetical protein